MLMLTQLFGASQGLLGTARDRERILSKIYHQTNFIFKLKAGQEISAGLADDKNLIHKYQEIFCIITANTPHHTTPPLTAL